MTKAAAKGRTTTATKTDLDQYEAAMFAKQQFMSTALTMGWQLAVAVLVPLLFGIWLDKKFHSSPSYTLGAFMIAIFFGSMVVWRTVQGVNKDVADSSRKGRK